MVAFGLAPPVDSPVGRQRATGLELFGMTLICWAGPAER